MLLLRVCYLSLAIYCVFCAEYGSEYGRIQTLPHTMCPEWNNLNIPYPVLSIPPCTMRVDRGRYMLQVSSGHWVRYRFWLVLDICPVV